MNNLIISLIDETGEHIGLLTTCQPVIGIEDELIDSIRQAWRTFETIYNEQVDQLIDPSYDFNAYGFVRYLEDHEGPNCHVFRPQVVSNEIFLKGAVAD